MQFFKYGGHMQLNISNISFIIITFDLYKHTRIGGEAKIREAGSISAIILFSKFWDFCSLLLISKCTLGQLNLGFGPLAAYRR